MAKRAVVVGTSFGMRVHVPALRDAGFEVVALVGTDLDRTRRRADRVGIKMAARSLQEAVDVTGPDVITIATPPHTHRDLTLEAIAAGAHVVCEKPMATNASEAREMTAAAAEAGVIALVGNELRWDPPVAACTHAINGGLIGTPHTATVTRAYSILASADSRMPAWWYDRSLGGGWMAANGSHLIDQLQLWMGPFAEVCAVTNQIAVGSRGTAEDSYHLLFRTATGATGVLQESAACWGDQVELTMIAGANATLTLDQFACTLREPSGSRSVPSPWTAPGAGATQHSLAWTGREIDAYVGMAHWLRRAMDGEPQPVGPSAASFADGLSVMRVLDAAHESSANGCWVPVDR